MAFDPLSGYDAGGTLVNQVLRQYNGLGQLTAEYQSHNGAVNLSTTPKVQYGYSDLAHGSRLVSMTYPDGRVLNYNYATGLDDAISRLSSISDASGTLESYTYLGLSTVVQRSHPQSGVDLSYIKQTGEANGEAGDQYTGLDRFGQIVDQRWTNGTTDLDRYQYTYDRDGNRTAKANVLNTSLSETYAYDSLNRLTSMSRGGSNTAHQSWNLDALGNSNSVTTDGVAEARTYNSQNQLTQMGTATLGFDANGNETLDQNGKTFVYDAWNRQVEVKEGETSLRRYAFDALNRRISEGESQIFYSANWQQLEERNSSGQTTVQYVWSPVYVDAMIERDRDTDGNGTLDERLYVMQDANFNVTGLTTTSGTVAERFVYDAYGARTVLTGNWQITADAFVFLQGHQGGKMDSISGKLHFRNREYDVETMRWMGEDPVQYFNGMSLYQLEGGNSINRLDPNGEFWSWIGAGIGAGIGAVVGSASYLAVSAYTGQSVSWGGLAGAAAGGATTGAITGLVAGALTGDPTGLMVAGVVAGATGGAVQSTTQQLIDTGTVDGTKVGESAMVGGAIGGLSAGAGSVLSTATNTLVDSGAQAGLQGINGGLATAGAAATGVDAAAMSGFVAGTTPAATALYQKSQNRGPCPKAKNKPMLGAKGTQVTSKTTWQGKGGRIDVENPAPGQRPGQIHYQDSQGNKYLYDPVTGKFNNAPPSVNKMLENNAFKKGIDKALKYLGE